MISTNTTTNKQHCKPNITSHLVLLLMLLIIFLLVTIHSSHQQQEPAGVHNEPPGLSTTSTTINEKVIISSDSDSINSKMTLYRDGSSSIERTYLIDPISTTATINQIMTFKLNQLSPFIDPKSFMANIIVIDQSSSNEPATTQSTTPPSSINLLFKEHIYAQQQQQNDKSNKDEIEALKQRNQSLEHSHTQLSNEKNNLQDKIHSYEGLMHHILQSKFELNEYEQRLKIIEQLTSKIEETRNQMNIILDNMSKIRIQQESLAQQVFNLQKGASDSVTTVDNFQYYFEFTSKIPKQFLNSKFKLLIRYTIQSGKFQWYPHYVLSVDSKSQAGELLFMASVKQNSAGENFTNVQVELSTADHGMGQLAPSMPDLNVLTLDQTEIYKYLHDDIHTTSPSNFGQVYMMKSAAVPRAAAGGINQQQFNNNYQTFGNINTEQLNQANNVEFEHLMMDENSHVTTDVIKSTTSYTITERSTFTTSTLSTTPQPIVSLLIAKISLESTQWFHKVIPKQSTSVYTIMSIKNKSKYQLIPGQVDVFIDNVLSTQSRIRSNVFPDDLFNLDIGIDRMVAVKIQDHQKNQQQSSGWLFSSTTNHIVSDGSLISIENKKDVTVNITVVDALPFTNDWHKERQLEILLIQPSLSNDRPVNLQDCFKQLESSDSTTGKNQVIVPTEFVFKTNVNGKEIKCKIRKINHALERNLSLKPKEKISLALSYQISVNENK